MEEQQAISLLKKGDLEGLDTLIRLYYFRAVKTAYLIVQDRLEAEDIVQNAFIHAYEKIDQLASERFGPWFLRSIVNTSIKAAQKQKKQTSISAEIGDADQSLEDLLIDQQPSPETLVELGELSQVVWQSLQRLSSEQRAAVVLKYYLDMSEVEMTAELNQPVSTIKWWLYTARKRLKDMLRPYFFPSKSTSRQSPLPSEKQE